MLRAWSVLPVSTMSSTKMMSLPVTSSGGNYVCITYHYIILYMYVNHMCIYVCTYAYIYIYIYICPFRSRPPEAEGAVTRLIMCVTYVR